MIVILHTCTNHHRAILEQFGFQGQIVSYTFIPFRPTYYYQFIILNKSSSIHSVVSWGRLAKNEAINVLSINTEKRQIDDDDDNNSGGGGGGDNDDDDV